MSSKYEVIRKENKNFQMCSIKLENGKKCLFWYKKGANNFNKITVTFSNIIRINIDNQQICISFDGVNSKEDINNLLVAFGTEVYKDKVDITKIDFDFVVDNREQVSIANEFMKKYNLKGNVTHSEKYNQLTENLEDAINNIATNTEDSQVIKEENNEIKKYLVHDNKVYNDNDTLSIAEKKKMLLSKWRRDPIKSLEIYPLPREEVDRRLTEAVTDNLKVHYMESSVDESKPNNNFEKVANNLASSEDGKVNREFGIVQNNPKSENKFSAVEKDGEQLNVVNPHVINENIYNDNISRSEQSSYGVDTVTTGVDSSFWNDDNDLSSLNVEDEDIQERNGELPVFYLDSSQKIYNQYGEFVGRNGVGGYLVDENNNLQRYSKVIGQLGDINDMGKNAARENSKVRVFKPRRTPDYNTELKEAGVVSLPIIIFIISLFLLIASGIILFLMK